jgi:hypothetical protein
MSRASETQMGSLHGILAQVIAAQVGATEEYLDEEGELNVMYSASPALLAIAAKFLKDNEITCAVELDENLGKLEAIMANKQKKGRLALVDTPMIKEA